MAQQPYTISSLLKEARQKLENTSTSPLLDAQLLLADVLGKDRSYLMAWPEAFLESGVSEQFQKYLNHRLKGIPVAYILGYKEFWSMSFKVTPDVLIPRPETELLVEQAITMISHMTKPHILDLGTGSGAIAIAVGKELPKAEITATDVSIKALAIAKANARRLNTPQIHFLQSHWFTQIQPNTVFDLIVSNPPYIARQDPHLEKEIKHEPKLALIAGDDGLNDIRLITKTATRHLKPNGILLFEHGYKQGKQVASLMREAGFTDCRTLKDYAGNERITYGLIKQ